VIVLSEKTIVEEALNCVEFVANYASRSKEDSEIARKFRSRARETPVYSFTHGLAYTLTLLAARSSKSLLEYGLLEAQSCKDVVERVFASKRSSEEVSYGLYGAILLYVLERGKIIESKTFPELVREALTKPALEVKAKPVLEWIKRFAEAYIEAEK
jgi:CRISPR type III-B/RAMP module-associated protein Cmr5